MSSGGRDGLEAWGEQHLASIRKEREKLERRLNAFTAEIEKLEAQRKQMLISREEQKDTELNPEYDLMMERGIARVTNKQAELKQRQSEMIKRLGAYKREEQQLLMVLKHERFSEWAALKQRRDQTAAELARLDAELRQLLDSMLCDLQAEQ